jgi:hypothetical protein
MKHLVIALTFLIGFSSSAVLNTESPGIMEGETVGGPMPGGIAPLSASEGYDDALLVHKKAHQDKYLSSTCAYEVDKILSYSTQVVSGIMTRVKFTIKGKGCRDLTCRGKVWSQPWKGAPKIDGYNCE